jgi:5-methylcytosine-specific restriction endonuclease McrA
MISLANIQSHGLVGHYERKGIYAVDEILPFVRHDDEWVLFDGDEVKMSSARYHLFTRQTACQKCGIIGLFFAKERSVFRDKRTPGKFYPSSHRFHFNLYGINARGHQVMLTKDHIMPRAHGGSDEQSNFQTLCAPCNSRKRDRLPNETDHEYAERRKLELKIEKERNAKPSMHKGVNSSHYP